MIPEPAIDRNAGVLSAVQSAVGLAVIVTMIVAILVGGEGEVPGWLGLLITALVGVIAGFSVRWYRRRPIEVGDWQGYVQTVIVRFAIAVDPVVVGTIMAIVGDSVFPAIVGAVLSILGLALAPVSESDYQRHQTLFIDQAAEVPKDKWGAADPAAEAPWETLEEGHGHGLSH